MIKLTNNNNGVLKLALKTKFTQVFYQYLFQGTKICEAFDLALQSVEFIENENEANLFVLLKSDDDKAYWDFR